MSWPLLIGLARYTSCLYLSTLGLSAHIDKITRFFGRRYFSIQSLDRANRMSCCIQVCPPYWRRALPPVIAHAGDTVSGPMVAILSNRHSRGRDLSVVCCGDSCAHYFSWQFPWKCWPPPLLNTKLWNRQRCDVCALLSNLFLPHKSVIFAHSCYFMLAG